MRELILIKGQTAEAFALAGTINALSFPVFFGLGYGVSTLTLQLLLAITVDAYTVPLIILGAVSTIVGASCFVWRWKLQNKLKEFVKQ